MILIWGAIIAASLWLASDQPVSPANAVLLAAGLLIGAYLRKAEPAGFKSIVGFGTGMLALIAAASGRLEPVAAAADIPYRALIGAVGLAGVAVVALSLIAYIYSVGEHRG